jgi:hypothetical protein
MPNLRLVEKTKEEKEQARKLYAQRPSWVAVVYKGRPRSDVRICVGLLANALFTALCLLVFDDPVEFLAVCPNNKAGEAQRGWARRSMVR